MIILIGLNLGRTDLEKIALVSLKNGYWSEYMLRIDHMAVVCAIGGIVLALGCDSYRVAYDKGIDISLRDRKVHAQSQVTVFNESKLFVRCEFVSDVDDPFSINKMWLSVLKQGSELRYPVLVESKDKQVYALSANLISNAKGSKEYKKVILFGKVTAMDKKEAEAILCGDNAVAIEFEVSEWGHYNASTNVVIMMTRHS